MNRTFRLVVVVLFVFAGLSFPSVSDAQHRGGGNGGGGRGSAAGRGGGAVVHGGGSGGSHGVAVPRTYPPYSGYRPYYSHPYYYRPYYYRPYYSGYYPYYSSPWSFSLSFGFGWYGGYAPLYAYPAYPYPYAPAYPAYPYPYYQPPSPYPSQNPSQPQYPGPTSYNGYDTRSTSSGSYAGEGRNTTARVDSRGEFGTLSIRVIPSDATILIDHQVWDRPRGDEHFSIELVGGSHQVEIRSAGYTTYARAIDVPPGRSIVLNVALTVLGGGTMQAARTAPLRH